MTAEIHKIWVKEEDLYLFNHNAIESLDMARWRWYYPEVGVRECRLYIVKGETVNRPNDRYYARLYQGPRPGGDYAKPRDPHDPDPPPDNVAWSKITELPYLWWQQQVENADHHPETEGFIKQGPIKCFEADFDPDDGDWGAPTLLHVVDV